MGADTGSGEDTRLEWLGPMFCDRPANLATGVVLCCPSSFASSTRLSLTQEMAAALEALSGADGAGAEVEIPCVLRSSADGPRGSSPILPLPLPFAKGWTERTAALTLSTACICLPLVPFEGSSSSAQDSAPRVEERSGSTAEAMLAAPTKIGVFARPRVAELGAPSCGKFRETGSAPRTPCVPLGLESGCRIPSYGLGSGCEVAGTVVGS